MKVRVLYFVTDKLIKFKKINVNQLTGTARMGKTKEFQFDGVQPLTLETSHYILFKKLVPFYIVKHDLHKPLAVNFRTIESKNELDMVVTPENFKNIMHQGTLNTLLTLSGGVTSQMLLYIGIGLAMGFLLGQVIPIGSLGG